jgi:beta-glucosidase-like glycosyl hydrolase
MSEVIDALVAAVEQGEISQQELDEHVLRVLECKKQIISEESITLTPEDRLEHEALIRTLYTEAITMLDEEQHFSPINTSQTALVTIGGRTDNALARIMQQEGAQAYHLMAYSGFEVIERILPKVKQHSTVVVALYGITHNLFQNFGISLSTKFFIQELKKSGINPIIIIFGTPYSVATFDADDTLIVCYEEHELLEEGVVEILQGKRVAHGRLPVKVERRKA